MGPEGAGQVASGGVTGGTADPRAEEPGEVTGSPAGAGDGKSGRRVTAHITPGCRPASWSDVDSEAAVWLGTLGPAGPVCGLPGPRAPPSVGLAEGREASQCASGRPRAGLRAPFPVPLLRPRAPRLLPRPADLSRAVGGRGAVPADSGAWTRVKSWGKTFVPCLLRVDLSSALGRECRALPRPAAPSCHILRFRSAISARQAIAVPTATNEGATPDLRRRRAGWDGQEHSWGRGWRVPRSCHDTGPATDPPFLPSVYSELMRGPRRTHGEASRVAANTTVPGDRVCSVSRWVSLKRGAAIVYERHFI